MKVKEYFNNIKTPLVFREEITIPIEVGDIILGGKFKNKKVEVKEIGENDKGDPTINGKPLLRFRIPKDKIEKEDKNQARE